MRGGLLVSEVAARTGVGRKALRLYERLGILEPAARCAAGWRLYPADAVAVVRFVAQARWLGFSLEEIREIVTIRRNGRPPCAHVRRLAGARLAAIERALRNLRAVRSRLAAIASGHGAAAAASAAVCPHIEGPPHEGRPRDGTREGVALPRLHRMSRGRGRW